jgi:hypothetical protein
MCAVAQGQNNIHGEGLKKEQQQPDQGKIVATMNLIKPIFLK